jgi:hypothetical protein
LNGWELIVPYIQLSYPLGRQVSLEVICCSCFNGAFASVRAISSLPGSSTVAWLILQR